MTPIFNNHFYLHGIEYYKSKGKYYTDNGIIREEIADNEYHHAIMEWYVYNSKSHTKTI